MNVTDIVDLDRYPIAGLGSPAGRAVVAARRAALARDGLALMPGFLRAQALAAMRANRTRCGRPRTSRKP